MFAPFDARSTEHLAACRAFADRVGKRADLEENLTYLETYACHGDPEETICYLWPDRAPYSFEFTIKRRTRTGLLEPVTATPDAGDLVTVPTGATRYKFWFNGGLLYHGAHDGHGSGSGPTFAVTLTPTDGWSIHT